jgi:adenylate cyclase
MIDQTTDEVIARTNSFLYPLETEAVHIAQLVDERAMDSERPRLTKYMLDSVRQHPHFWSIMIGWEDGTVLQVINPRGTNYGKQKNPEKTDYVVRQMDRRTPTHIEDRHFFDAEGKLLEIQKDPEDSLFIPMKRPWYIGARERNALYWTDLYMYSTLRKPGLTAAVPFHTPEGKLDGVVATDLRLDHLSTFLRELQIGRNGVVFIINERQEVVAQADDQPVPIVDGEPQLVRIENVRTAWLREAVERWQTTGHDKLRFKASNGVEYLASFAPLKVAAHKSWTVAVVVPMDDFIGPLREANRQQLKFSLGMMLLGILAIALFGGLISRPVRKLAVEAGKIERFELEGDIDIPSRITEVEELSRSMARMKTGIQAFSKFVPKGLVQQLMTSGAGVELGGEKRDLVVLFTDVAGFTGISETMEAEELALHVSAYFEEMTTILMANRGVIDKFIGDAVMAFWGAPFDNDERYVDACTAVLAMRDRLDVLNAEWEAEGKPALRTRFGLHAGTAFVGNTGSSDRMNYSAFGDVVNLASRLEGMNGQYGSTICVSEELHEHVADAFLMRPLDLVAVKGRKGGTRVYELLCDRESVTDEIEHLCTESERALEAYLQGRFTEAIAHYESVLEIAPDDGPVRVMLARCRVYRDAPPSDGWDGVYVATTK